MAQIVRLNGWELDEAQRAYVWDRVHRGEVCWAWTGTIGPDGYGRLWFNGVIYMAHRIVYELLMGPITEETLDHLCRNRPCVRPSHLEPVSRGENMLRGETNAGRNRRKTHCVRGHPFDEENTRFRATGGRRCIACSREDSRRANRGKKKKA
jgi:hypothetical protein